MHTSCEFFKKVTGIWRKGKFFSVLSLHSHCKKATWVRSLLCRLPELFQLHFRGLGEEAAWGSGKAPRWKSTKMEKSLPRSASLLEDQLTSLGLCDSWDAKWSSSWEDGVGFTTSYGVLEVCKDILAILSKWLGETPHVCFPENRDAKHFQTQ